MVNQINYSKELQYEIKDVVQEAYNQVQGQYRR